MCNFLFTLQSLIFLRLGVTFNYVYLYLSYGTPTFTVCRNELLWMPLLKMDALLLGISSKMSTVCAPEVEIASLLGTVTCTNS